MCLVIPWVGDTLVVIPSVSDWATLCSWLPGKSGRISSVNYSAIQHSCFFAMLDYQWLSITHLTFVCFLFGLPHQLYRCRWVFVSLKLKSVIWKFECKMIVKGRHENQQQLYISDAISRYNKSIHCLAVEPHHPGLDGKKTTSCLGC